jgi:hypothetical protein
MIDVSAAGACDHAAVYLDYDVVAQGPVEPATTITFINPVGDDVRVSHVPLRGRAMWPGIVLRHDGTVIDWPGWRKENGVWVAGDEFDWAVNDVVVEFEAGSVANLVVEYPDANDSCIPTPQGAVDFSGASPTTPPTIDPPATSTLDLQPAVPDGRPTLLLLLFAATLTAAGFGVAFRRTARVAGPSVHIETAAEFTSRVARTRRTRPARRSSAPARSRAPRA